MNHESWLELAEIYALGTLGGEDLRRFEEHLASGCPECAGELENTRRALTLLPGSLEPVAPPSAVKHRVMRAIGGAPESSACARLVWAMAAALGLLVFLLVQSNTRLTAVRGELASLRAEISGAKATLALLTSPESEVIRLKGLTLCPEASGILVWDVKTHKGLFLGQCLPQTAIGKVYQLWGIEADIPVPAGVFAVGKDGRAFMNLAGMPAGRTFDKFAVTLEPSGGTPLPTGQMFLLGSTS